MKIEFTSRAPATSRLALEDLLFFNPGQRAIVDGIMRSVELFGKPRIVPMMGGLTVELEGHDAQTLFAFDRAQSRDVPFAVAIYMRTRAQVISIAHVAVHPDYCLQSRKIGLGLGVMLLKQIQQIAARIRGVRRVEFSYLQRSVAVCRAL